VAVKYLRVGANQAIYNIAHGFIAPPFHQLVLIYKPGDITLQVLYLQPIDKKLWEP
jgi:hypothetical protein